MKIRVIEESCKRVKNKTIVRIITSIRYNDNTLMPSSVQCFEGVAKCYDDKYDYKIGRRIALARAEIKAYKYYKNVLIELNDIYQTLATDSAKLYDKIRKQISHNKEYIGDIVSGSNN